MIYATTPLGNIKIYFNNHPDIQEEFETDERRFWTLISHFRSNRPKDIASSSDDEPDPNEPKSPTTPPGDSND